jgi:Ca2+-binding EF-hand superfamily protein
MDSTDSSNIDLDRLEIPDFSEFESEHFKKEILLPYFKDIFRDLSSRSDNKKAGINKVTIIDYCQLPGILAERFFSLLDDNKDEYIDLKEFVQVLHKIYYSKFEDQVKLVFNIYDFDQDGFITKEDVRIILSYIPVLRDENAEESEKEGTFSQGGGGYDEFSTRIQIQEEISDLIELVFKDGEKINLNEFQKINETISSDMLVTVLTLLRDKLPCSEKFYKLQNDFMNENECEKDNKKKPSLTVDTKTKSIPSPNVLKSLSPLAKKASRSNLQQMSALSHLQKIVKQDSFKENSKGISEEDIDLCKFKSKNKKNEEGTKTNEIGSPELKGEMVRMANQNKEPKSLLSKDAAKNQFASPTAFLSGSGVTKEDSPTGGQPLKAPIQFTGEMARKARENKLKKYWYVLSDKELYAYKDKDSEKHKTMLNLIGVFLRVDPDEALDKKNILYPFTLIFPNKERTFYLLTAEDRNNWVSQIK